MNFKIGCIDTMPCNDVTEILNLVIDENDRLEKYALIKRTCGRAVGEKSLLDEEFAGRPAEEILAIGADAFADAREGVDETELFLALKHLFAVQGGLKALLGLEPGGKDEAVRVAGVSYEGGRVRLDAEIVLDVITRQIEACGRCSGCGVKAKLAEKAST